MAQTYIQFPVHHLGAEEYSIEETEAQEKLFTPAQHLKEAGFGKHWRCSQDQTAYDLATSVTNKIDTKIKASGRDGIHSVDGIIYANCFPENACIGDRQLFSETGDIKPLLDYPASHLQADFGMDKAFVVGLTQQACTSMLGSVRLANAYLQAESALESFYCITADRFPDGAKYEQSYNLISDGAAGVLISKEEVGYRYIAGSQITNGAMAQADDDETVGHYFNYSKKVISDCLVTADLTIDDIDFVVPQNTNKVAWQILCSVLGIDIQKVRMESIGEVAHVISSDNIINLEMLEETNEVESGSTLLLLMAGFGLNWQCLLVEKV